MRVPANPNRPLAAALPRPAVGPLADPLFVMPPPPFGAPAKRNPFVPLTAPGPIPLERLIAGYRPPTNRAPTIGAPAPAAPAFTETAPPPVAFPPTRRGPSVLLGE